MDRVHGKNTVQIYMLYIYTVNIYYYYYYYYYTLLFIYMETIQLDLKLFYKLLCFPSFIGD